jgi:hypothetical protein
MHELEMIFQKEITNWKRFDEPDAEIVVVGREPTEALFSELKRYYAFFNRSEFDIVFDNDNDVVKFLESPQGWHAISFGAKTSLAHLNIVAIKEGIDIGVRVGLVYDRKHLKNPLVIAVKEYAQSEEWRAIVDRSEAYPVK